MKSKCPQCHYNYLKKRPEFCINGECMDAGGVSNSLGTKHLFERKKMNNEQIEIYKPVLN